MKEVLEELLIIFVISAIGSTLLFLVAIPYFFKKKAGSGKLNKNDSDNYKIK